MNMFFTLTVDSCDFLTVAQAVESMDNTQVLDLSVNRVRETTTLTVLGWPASVLETLVSRNYEAKLHSLRNLIAVVESGKVLAKHETDQPQQVALLLMFFDVPTESIVLLPEGYRIINRNGYATIVSDKYGLQQGEKVIL